MKRTQLCFASALALAILLMAAQTSRAAVMLGYGAGALLKSDLTDPDNNINDNVAANPPYYGTGYDWLAAYASTENWFSPGSGSEASLDLFDNKVGSGEAKYCCNGGTQWVAVQLPKQYVMTHFTIASDNDSGTNRDPDIWAIQGSNNSTNGNDGVWTDIFSYNSDGTSPFNLGGGSVENKVLRYDGGGTDFATPAPYQWFRFQATSYGSANVLGLSELEFFGVTQPALTATPGSGSTLDFGVVPGGQTGTVPFSLENTGTLGSTIDVTGVVWGGPDAALFGLPIDPVGLTLVGGAGPEALDVEFLGSTELRSFLATLTLQTLDENGVVGSVLYNLSASVVPEPSTLALLVVGMLSGLAILQRRRKQD